jgi:phage terminase large subunit GpA-like protein
MALENIRDDKGKLPAYAFPGGYPILYYAKDGGVLCPKCANEFTPERDNAEQLEPVSFDVFYEGSAVQCEHCNAEIESAYGDPDSQEND